MTTDLQPGDTAKTDFNAFFIDRLYGGEEKRPMDTVKIVDRDEHAMSASGIAYRTSPPLHGCNPMSWIDSAWFYPAS